MAVLEYAVVEADAARWSTVESISSSLGEIAIKRLSISTDPLVDPTVLAPEEAYEITNL